MCAGVLGFSLTSARSQRFRVRLEPEIQVDVKNSIAKQHQSRRVGKGISVEFRQALYYTSVPLSP